MRSLLLFVLALSTSVNAVSPSLLIRGAGDVGQRAASRHSRKLLACFALDSPTFKSPDGTFLPFCSTQRINTGGSGWAAVTPGASSELFSSVAVTAADLAHAWVTDAVNPRTDSSLQCSGDVDTSAKRRCWGGNGPYIDTIFASLSCCSTAVLCGVKSGGCVL